MTSLDIIVLLLMGGAGLLGLSRGFVTEALSLLAWVGAIAAVKLLHAPVSKSLEAAIGTPSGAATLSAALIFGLAMFGGRKLARSLGSQTRNSFVGPFDRALMLDRATVIWLDADIDTLVDRTSRKNDRPLLAQGNPREILTKLAAERNPIYAQAHIHVKSDAGPHEAMLNKILKEIR